MGIVIPWFLCVRTGNFNPPCRSTLVRETSFLFADIWISGKDDKPKWANSWEINQFSNNLTSIWRNNSCEATIIAVEKPVALWWYLKKPIEHLLNRLYCTFSCNITFNPFTFDVLFTTNNCSSRLVNDSKYLSCHALVRATGVHQFRFDCTRPNLIVIAFFIENTTMDAVSRCISCGFPNRRKQLLETTKPPFRQIISYIKIMWEVIVVKNTTAPKIRRFRCC